MQQSGPGLLPLFRSGTQLEILGVLFTEPEDDWHVSGLARHVGRSGPAVSREVATLAKAGIVKVRSQGRNTLVAANWDVPWAEPLAELLDRTIGPLAHLARALGEVDGISSAWVYGSWAERYHGIVGPAPRDIDVMVVGDNLDLLTVGSAVENETGRAGVEVNVQTVSRREWDRPRRDSFIDQLKKRALVPIPLAEQNG